MPSNQNPILAQAADPAKGYVLLEQSVTVPAGINKASGTPTTLTEYIQSVYVILFIAVMLAAVIALVIYGAQYMFSNVYSLKINAKERIIKVAWGVGIALVSWLILDQINPDLATKLLVNIPFLN
ncbi:MAG: hypothetical protein WCV68_02885 [Candidatus Paceibacterota bacterium]|jgi:hypothetical protein